MNDQSVHVANTYWATMFGCRVADLRPRHGLAFAHAGFDGYDGAYGMMFDDAAPIVSVRAEVLARAEALTRARQPGSIRSTAQVTAIFGDRADRIIGPAALLYADASNLLATPAAHIVRRLTRDSEADWALVGALRSACSDAEWETGGSDFEHDVAFGAFVGTSLAALAGYEVWGDHIAHLAIVTHPDWRGRGLASAAVVGWAQYALSHQLVLQYRSLESNTPSLRIAHRLGFTPFATSVAVRAQARSA